MNSYNRAILNEIVNNVDSYDLKALNEFETMMKKEWLSINELSDVINSLPKQFWFQSQMKDLISVACYIEDTECCPLVTELMVVFGKAYVNSSYRGEFETLAKACARASQDFKDIGFAFKNFDVIMSFKDYITSGQYYCKHNGGGYLYFNGEKVSLYSFVEPGDIVSVEIGNKIKPLTAVINDYKTRKLVSFYCAEMNRKFGIVLKQHETYVQEIEREAQRLYDAYEYRKCATKFIVNRADGQVFHLTF